MPKNQPPEPKFRREVRDRRHGGGRSPVQTRKIERFYSAQLRKIARHVGELINGSPTGTLSEALAVSDALNRYARIIGPWAKATAEQMLAQVSQADRKVWMSHSAQMGRLLRAELAQGSTANLMNEALQRQIGLIKSLPVEAGERLQKLVVESQSSGQRASEIATEIARSGEVAQSRAMTIARTEVSTAVSTITEARSLRAGSPGYIWRTGKDSDVRPSHRQMEGKFVAWDSPPTLDGMTGHAGRFPNCRCYPEPVLPDFD